MFLKRKLNVQIKEQTEVVVELVGVPREETKLFRHSSSAPKQISSNKSTMKWQIQIIYEISLGGCDTRPLDECGDMCQILNRPRKGS